MKLLKRFIYLLAILVVLLIGAGVLAPHVINPNHYKDKLIALVHEKTGRDLLIRGDISWSFFPWVGVRIQDAQLSNAAGFAPQDRFASVGEADIKVKLLPLLSRQVEVGKVTLRQLELNLAKNQQGVNNWQDLSSVKSAGVATAAETKQPSRPGFMLSIAGVDIQNAQIVWTDAQQGRSVTLSNLQMSSDNPATGRAFPFSMAFDINSNKPALAGHFTVKSAVLVDLDKAVYQLNDLAVSFAPNQSKQAITLQSQQILADLHAQTLAVNKGVISSGDLNAKLSLQGQQILTQPMFSGQLQAAAFNLKNVLAVLGKPLVTSNPAALQKVAFNGQFQATGSAISLKPLLINIDGSTIEGALAVTDLASQSLQMDLTADHFRVDDYLPPSSSIQAGAGASAGVTPAGASVGAASSQSSALRTAKIKGSLHIGTLTSADKVLRQVYAQLALNNGILQVNPLNADIYGGSTRGKLSVDFRAAVPKYTIDETLTNIDMAQLVKSGRIIGKANLTSHLNLQGQEPAAMLQSLNGNLQFDVQNGALVGADVPYEVQRALALLKRQPPPPAPAQDQTNFDVLKGSGTFNQGVFSNNDLLAQSSQFKATGRGTANLLTQALDYHLQLVGLHRVTDAQGDVVQEERQTPIPIMVSGTFSKPVVTPDVRAFLQSEAGKKAIERVQDRLENRLGPGAGRAVGGVLRQFLQQ